MKFGYNCCMEAFYTAAEVARLLGIHRTTIYRRIRAGRVPPADAYTERQRPLWAAHSLAQFERWR